MLVKVVNRSSWCIDSALLFICYWFYRC